MNLTTLPFIPKPKTLNPAKPNHEPYKLIDRLTHDALISTAAYGSTSMLVSRLVASQSDIGSTVKVTMHCDIIDDTLRACDAPLYLIPCARCLLRIQCSWFNDTLVTASSLNFNQTGSLQGMEHGAYADRVRPGRQGHTLAPSRHGSACKHAVCNHNMPPGNSHNVCHPIDAFRS